MSSSHEQIAFQRIYSRANTKDIGYFENRITGRSENERAAKLGRYRDSFSPAEQDIAFRAYVSSGLYHHGKINVILRNWITIHIGKPNEVYAREQAHRHANEIRAAMTPTQLKGRKA